MKNYPAIKFVLLFITGILINYIFPVTIQNYFVYLALLFLTFISAIYFFLTKQKEIVSKIPIYLFVVLSGIFITVFQKPNYNFLPVEIIKQKDFHAYGTISKVELIKESEIIFNLNTDSVLIQNRKLITSVDLICRIRNGNKKSLDSLYEVISPGNIISISGTFMKGRDKRNPGEFDYNQYLKNRGISGIVYAYSSNDFKIINSKYDHISKFIFTVRKDIDEKISALHQFQTAAFLRGQILADRSNIDYDAVTEFINSGVVHILAVSGLNVGFIVIIFIILFGRFNVYLRSFLMMTGIIIFLLLTDTQPSIVRAIIMSILLLIGFLTNRSTNMLNSLAVSAIIILIIDPRQLFDPGFQLSYSAVLSIVLIYPIFQKLIHSLKIKLHFIEYLLLFIGVSLCAQIGTMPFTLLYFGKLSLVSLFTNMIVIPVSGMVVGIGIFTLMLNTVLPVLAFYFASANDLLTSLMFYIIKVTGRFEYAFVWIRNFSIPDSIIFYSLLIILLYSIMNFKSRIAKFLIFILASLNLLIFCSLDDKYILPKNILTVMMIDVGQGDAFLIKFPNGETALIDAGEVSANFDNGEKIILPLLNYFNIDKIDYGFVSHVDADHYGGFISLINENKIKRIIKPQLDTAFTKDIKFEKFLYSKKIPFDHYSKNIMKISNCRIYILNDIAYNQKTTSNGKSGLLKIVYGKNSLLFTGDLDRKVEMHYVESYKTLLNSDILKVSHHGSKTASSNEFISYVKPKVSLISAGIQNKFGHPSTEVLERLKTIGSKIFRTDKSGAVLLRSNGENIFAVDWRKL